MGQWPWRSMAITRVRRQSFAEHGGATLAMPKFVHLGTVELMVVSKTLYNKTVNSPQNVKSLSVLSPGIGSWN